MEDDRAKDHPRVLSAPRHLTQHRPRFTMKNIFRSLLAALCVLALPVAALAASPALVGNKGLGGQALDAETVKAVLLGKKVTLGDTRVVIVIAKNSEAQDQFLQQTV